MTIVHTPAATTAWPKKLELFGVGVSPTNYAEATAAVLAAARDRRGGAVGCHSVHALMEASRRADLRACINGFEMVTPDGQPVRWALNALHDCGLAERVYGPELMLRLCRQAAEEGTSVYLYGASPQTLGLLVDNLRGRIPRLVIAGAESPPFRPLSDAEEREAAARFNASGAGIVFLGLGTPKQDYLAGRLRSQVAGVLVCVGAAFDFHAGTKRTAPAWMQRRGLEWLFRLWEEPRRLAGRYLVTNTLFAWKLARALALRRFRPSSGRRG